MSFDKDFFNKYVGKRFRFLMEQNWIILQDFQDNKSLWRAKSYYSEIVNGKQSVSEEVLRKMALFLWMTDKSFDLLVAEAKKAEYEHTTGKKLIEGELEGTDWKIALREDEGLTAEQAKEVMKYIEFVKGK